MLKYQRSAMEKKPRISKGRTLQQTGRYNGLGCNTVIICIFRVMTLFTSLLPLSRQEKVKWV